MSKYDIKEEFYCKFEDEDNKTLEQLSTIFESSKISKIMIFLQKSTAEYDESHDFIHAWKVLSNSIKISKKIKLTNEEIIITIQASLMHDICDHKQTNSVTLNDIHNFTSENENKSIADKVMEVINNISQSKEEKQGQKDLGELKQVRDIVSDADKLEALGEVGMRRCEVFNKARGNAPKDVVQHCHDKLLRLKDNQIRTQVGKELAIEGHDFILDQVSKFNGMQVQVN